MCFEAFKAVRAEILAERRRNIPRKMDELKLPSFSPPPPFVPFKNNSANWYVEAFHAHTITK